VDMDENALRLSLRSVNVFKTWILV
jgi:hypothetical protein